MRPQPPRASVEVGKGRLYLKTPAAVASGSTAVRGEFRYRLSSLST